MPPQDKGEITRDGHIIRIRKDIRAPQMRYFVSQLHQAIEQQVYKDITLDFTECDFMAEACMLPLLPLIVRYRQNDVDFKFLPPEKDETARLFHNTNWAHFIEPDNNDEAREHRGGHVPAIQFSNGDICSAAINRVLELLLGKLNITRQQLKNVEWALGEITDNVLVHADSQVGGFVQATAYQDSRAVECVIADAGIGIPRSLGMADNPRQAVAESIKRGVTRDKESNQGNGLYGAWQLARDSQGSFVIESQRAWLHFDGRVAKMQTGINKIPYNGTFILCRIGLENPDLLLRFGNVPHDPPYDYVEREFEQGKEQEMIFPIKKYRAELQSRAGGRTVHQTLKNLLAESKNSGKVIVDFDDVSIITSSFADEVFGRLYVQLGPHYHRKLDIRNADPVILHLIDQAIVQRWETDRESNQRNSENDEGSAP